MLIVLIRHADAGERDPTRYPDDTLRPLTEKGRTVQARVSGALREHGIVFGTVLTSPWKRAAQTADVLVSEMGLKIRPRPCDPLAAAPVVSKLAKAIEASADAEPIALVGHEPWLSELGSLLLTGSAQALTISFPKSGVLGLEMASFEAAGAQLKFFLRPKML